ncbi:hypothetical protein BDV96DRAFT_642601 [Lophiotrema nucula]|uniref:Uncharacterized protein n=1 Tax=Lophiotrema nucula TaxID=690887 RepID=A0A6A5ZMZ1_9PLEO|nr:hypothetical protein BDV96DRAFT_642601 [Lophiotrema nucula]
MWVHLTSALAVADPQITAPAVLPRQQQDVFIGWVETGGNWVSESCISGLTWYQDGAYVQCCPTTAASCYAPTACVSGSLIYPDTEISSTLTIACTDNFQNPSHSICNSAFIFENFDTNPATLGINSYYGQDTFFQQQMSPAPQYQSPYQPPGCPPLRGDGAFVPDQKQVYQQTARPEAAELGGASSATQPASISYTAELSGEAIIK